MAGSITVRLPTALQRLFPGASARVEVEAADIAGVLDRLDERWPGMRDRVCDSRPEIRRHIRVFVDGRRASLATAVAPGARVEILTAISGG